MRLLPSGSTALLVELDNLPEVLALYSALAEAPPKGVIDIVPAARTILLVTDPGCTSLQAVAMAVRGATADRERHNIGELLEVPVTYDGEDLDETAQLLGCDPQTLIRQHSADEWTVAFCGFAPGFGYLTSQSRQWNVPRRATPRVRVPAGAVALAGEFSGVYPRESPGGWQLIGHTDLVAFDLIRDPAALLRPGVRVRFVPQGTP